jgi:hypothetical protein
MADAFDGYNPKRSAPVGDMNNPRKPPAKAPPSTGRGTASLVSPEEEEAARVMELVLQANDPDNRYRRDKLFEEAAQIVARWPEEKQAAFYDQMDRNSNGYASRSADPLQSHVQRARAIAFQNGELLPGVDAAGGGTGLTPDRVQAILTGRETTAAQGILDDLEGLGEDSYTYDPTMDEGPGYSLLGRMRSEGAFHDETVDPYEAALEEAIAQERSDTTGYDAQKRSLSAYDDIINEEGLTAIDRARIERMRQDTARRGRAQEGAIMADMAERGRSSGIASSLLRQQAQQAATNERALGDMETAALGLQRKDTAIRNRGFLGGDMQAGVDAIDKFNTANRQDVQMRNKAAENAATSAAWGLELQREDQNVITSQNAIGTEYEGDTRRSSANADRANAASQFNVSPGQGKRGMIGDRLDAHEHVVNTMIKGPAFDADKPKPPPEPESDLFGATAGGAMSGGQAGSALGPWGTLGGGLIGGGLGLFGQATKKKRKQAEETL